MDLCQTHCKLCLIFPITRSRVQNGPRAGINDLVYSTSWFKLIKSQSIHMASSSSLPSGQYGLCFGYCFSGPLPLLSDFNSPPFGVCFRESLVLIDYTQKSTRSTLELKPSVAQPVYLWVTATSLLLICQEFSM